jgi:hypothetical protein
MSNRPAATEAESAADHAAEDSLFHREVLNELIGLGSDLARMIHGQAKDQAAARYADEGVPDVTVAFERVCQTVRRTILLCRKIAEPVPTRAAVQAAARRAAVRREVARAVEASIAEQATDGDAAGLRCELGERMERLEAEDADLERPVGRSSSKFAGRWGCAARVSWTRAVAACGRRRRWRWSRPLPHPGVSHWLGQMRRGRRNGRRGCGGRDEASPCPRCRGRIRRSCGRRRTSPCRRC